MVNLFPGVLTVDPTNPDVEFAPTSTSTSPWTDATDDLSQAIFYMTWDGATATRHGRVNSSLPALVGTPTNLYVHMRARTQMLSGTPEDLQMHVVLHNADGSTYINIGDGTGTLPNMFWSVAATPGFVDYTVEITDALCSATGTTKAAIIAGLQAANLQLQAQSQIITPHAPVDYQCLVAALWIEAAGVDAPTTSGVTSAPLTRGRSPLRQYPRSDGHGTSSARRIWPPSPSVQASNRRLGAYE